MMDLDGPLVSGQSLVTDGVAAGTAAAGLWERHAGLPLASSDASDGIAGINGLLTFATHDPSVHGAAGWGERLLMGGVEASMGLCGGAPAAVDSLTGGNSSGLLRGAAGSFMALADGAIRGDTDSLERNSDAMTGGRYGAAAGALGLAGDAIGQLLGMALGGAAEFDTTPMERFSEGLQQGGMLSPVTHAARLGDWLGPKLLPGAGADDFIKQQGMVVQKVRGAAGRAQAEAEARRQAQDAGERDKYMRLISSPWAR
jgi:hypothetical protein